MKRDIMSGASVTSHEFFHTWNVKRIRPVTLGPFEYEHENYTGNLWVSEGWTSYYGDLTMARAGVISHEEMLFKLQRAIAREMNKSARKEHSVYWASRNVWHSDRSSRVDYYAKGEILGALIDLKIRHETGNKKSLDDVMRFFNRWFAEGGIGFQENDVERACTAISNYDFSEFFARHVRGTVDPPIAECLSYAGIDYDPRPEIRAALPMPVRWGRRGSVTIGGESSRRYASNIRGGDQIIGINGKTSELRTTLGGLGVGDTVKITLKRADREFNAELKSISEERISPILRFSPSATPMQLNIRKGWLTGK
jgi:predicted metalloprotease with PDZ domain